MKRLLTEPLVHFLLAGGLLLGFVSFFGTPSTPPSDVALDRQIRVEEEELRRFVQAKTGIEDAAQFADRYADLDSEARREWVDRFVREEALVREARRLGLDRDDALIRRRLVQQIEFVALGVVDSELSFGPRELEATYRARREEYRVPATLSFSHVFVRASAEDDAAQRTRATALLTELNQRGVDASGALSLGDRFLYNRNYVGRTLDEVESHFGAEMAGAMGAFSSDPTSWQGPLRSSHGFHLVLLTHSEPSRLPDVGEIRDVLYEDWRRSLRDEALDRAVEEIISRYEIVVDAEMGSSVRR
jgi:peptidyl-prolyl cis-trans isomerase C